MPLDPWKILDLRPTKDRQQIEKVWRKLASLHHPDHGGDAEKFKEIREAYEQALTKSKTIVDVIRPASNISVNISLGCSEVLRPQYVNIVFEHNHKKLECSALIPEWEVEWGRNKFILVSTNDNINIMLNVVLEDDELKWNNQLVWRPKLELLPVLSVRQISLHWQNQHINIPVDCYGQGVLISQGYKNSQGERLDILVDPIYRWPEQQYDNFTS